MRVLLAFGAVGVLLVGGIRPQPAVDLAPRYNAAGELRRPENIETWVFVGASLGLSYSKTAQGAERFHNVYLAPNAYAHFTRTGGFYDGTMLAMTVHSAKTRALPRRSGRFEGDRLGLEVAVKDTKRFDEGWAYYDFSAQQASAAPFPPSRCHACHAEHAATDNVFTQFYPVLR